MSVSTVWILLLITLALPPADPAPVPTALAEALIQAQALVQKILQSLVPIHAQTVTLSDFPFDPSGHAPNHALLMSQLQIPPPVVLKPLAPPTFTQGDLLTRMWEGLEQQQRIVGALSSRLGTLHVLSTDLRDLQALVTTMMSSLGVATTVRDQSESSILSRIEGDYNTQAAAHLTLTALRGFCQDLNRGFRSLSSQLQPKS